MNHNRVKCTLPAVLFDYDAVFGCQSILYMPLGFAPLLVCPRVGHVVWESCHVAQRRLSIG